MRLASIIVDDRRLVGVEGPEGELLNAGRLLQRPELDMEALIAEGDSLLAELARRLAQPLPQSARLDHAQVAWQAPSPRPSKIVGVAINNRLGAALAYRPPVEPAYFFKPASALTGHHAAIVVPAEYGLTHPEPELAAVIARRSRNVAPADALDAVFGFTVINDITSPGLKDRDSMELMPPVALGSPPTWRRVRGDDDHSLYLTYHARSKGCDTFAPMGPWLVTRDAIPDPNQLDIRAWLDDELVLTDSTANLTFSVQAVIAHLSSYMTLEPGDVVHFGSAFHPASPERFPHVRSIDISRLDGTLSVEITGIGRLDNPIVRA